MQNNRVKQYANDDIDIEKKKREEEIYEKVFREKVSQFIEQNFSSREEKIEFCTNVANMRGVQVNTNRIEEVFDDTINYAIVATLSHNNPLRYYFDMIRNTNLLKQRYGEKIRRLRGLVRRRLDNEQMINNAITIAERNLRNREKEFWKAKYDEHLPNFVNQMKLAEAQAQKQAAMNYEKNFKNQIDNLKTKVQDLKMENQKMDDLLKLNNKKYLYNKQNFSNLLRQKNILKNFNKKKPSKLTLPKINNLVTNKIVNIRKNVGTNLQTNNAKKECKLRRDGFLL